MRRAASRRRPTGFAPPALGLALIVLLAACAPRLAPPDAPPAKAATPQIDGKHLRVADGTRLPLRVWPARGGAPKAVILGLHGFNDYSMAFDLPGSWFAAQGYTLYAYDQRGFGATAHAGLWPGTARLVGDLATAVRLLRARHAATPVYLLGASMGGAVILAAAGRDELPAVDGVVLAAPAVWARATMPIYQRWGLWLAAHTLPWLRLTGRGLDIQATDNLIELYGMGLDPLVIKATRIDAIYGLTGLMDEALAAGPSLPAPSLLLYGEKDEIIPPEAMLAFWRQVVDRPGHTPALYAEGWHMILRDRQAYTLWRDIESWIGHGNPLPSPADERAREALREGGL